MPLLCPSCPHPNVFKHTEALTRHMSVNHGYNHRPYVCLECRGSARFPTKASLEEHCRDDHGLTQYKVGLVGGEWIGVGWVIGSRWNKICRIQIHYQPEPDSTYQANQIAAQIAMAVRKSLAAPDSPHSVHDSEVEVTAHSLTVDLHAPPPPPILNELSAPSMTMGAVKRESIDTDFPIMQPATTSQWTAPTPIHTVLGAMGVGSNAFPPGPIGLPPLVGCQSATAVVTQHTPNLLGPSLNSTHVTHPAAGGRAKAKLPPPPARRRVYGSARRPDSNGVPSNWAAAAKDGDPKRVVCKVCGEGVMNSLPLRCQHVNGWVVYWFTSWLLEWSQTPLYV